MELRHLRYFCALADHGTFSKASRALHISQSAISEQIADLEQEIGGSLLDRSQRPTRLTLQGEVFLEEARKTLLAADRTVEMTRLSMQGQVGTLAIGFFLWGAGGFFARIIREYRRLYPNVRLSLYDMHTSVQMEALNSGQIDIGFSRPLEPPFARMFHSELLYNDPVVIALPREHPLAAPSIPIEALAAEPFVMCERAMTPALYDSMLALCSSAGFAPRIVNSSSTWSGILTLVESGEGVALVPWGTRHLRNSGVVLCKIEPATTHIGVSISWNPAREGPIQASFLRLVRDNKERIQRGGV
jgi:DNA-binding transcriptional LysR family regulator